MKKKKKMNTYNVDGVQCLCRNNEKRVDLLDLFLFAPCFRRNVLFIAVLAVCFDLPKDLQMVGLELSIQDPPPSHSWSSAFAFVQGFATSRLVVLFCLFLLGLPGHGVVVFFCLCLFRVRQVTGSRLLLPLSF